MPTGDGTYVSLAQLASEAKISGGFVDYAAGPPVVNPTNPSLTKAGEIIAEVEAKVTAKISQKYATPLAAASYPLVRGIAIALMVERVREIIAVKTGAASVEQIAAKTTADRARKDLDDIVKGDLPLPGETLQTAADGVRSYTIDNPLPAIFQRDKVQW